MRMRDHLTSEVSCEQLQVLPEYQKGIPIPYNSTGTAPPDFEGILNDPNWSSETTPPKKQDLILQFN